MQQPNEKRLNADIVQQDVESDGNETNAATLPVDRGWAWIILVGTISQMFFVNGTMRCNGILFVEIQKRFDSTATETSLINSVSRGFNCISALLLTTVGMKLVGCRVLVMTGGVICCTAFIITSQARTLSLLYLSHGMMMGIGQAILLPPMMSMVAVYFNKRRGLANSLTTCGASLGSIAMALLMTKLFEYYGFSGAFMVIAGFFLQACVSGSLYRPLDPAKVKEQQERQSRNVGNCKLAHDKEIDKEDSEALEMVAKPESVTLQTGSHVDTGHEKKPNMIDSFLMKNGNGVKIHSRSHESLPFLPHHVQEHRVPRRRTFSNASARSSIYGLAATLSNSTINMYSSSETLGLPDQLVLRHNTQQNEDFKDAKPGKKLTCKTSAYKLLKGILAVFDAALFKNPVFIILMASQSILFTSFSAQQIFIAPHARDVGLTEDQIGIIFATMSAVQVCARPILGIIADKNVMEKAHIVAVCASAVGVSAQCISLYTSYGTIFAFSVIYGVFGGVYGALLTVILVEYVGLERFRSAIGFNTLFTGSTVALGFYVVGLLRDSTGSYILPFRLLGVMNFTAAALLCVTAYVHRRRIREKDKLIK